jgi:Domain of unknown function (DUF4157)
LQELMQTIHPRSPRIGIQPKLRISHQDDLSEREADSLAERVTEGFPSLSESVAAAQSVKEEPKISRMPSATNSLEESGENANEISNIGSQEGFPLDSSSRQFMESRFRTQNFADVRIHTGEKAASSAESINALAFTVGNNIVFGKGQYNPGTVEGKKLLAHELTHVVQQRQISAESLAGAIHIQRQPRNKRTSKKEPLTPQLTVNDPANLKLIDPKDLAEIYATKFTKEVITNYGISFITANWVNGKGRKLIEERIASSIAGFSQQDLTNLLNIVDKMHPSEYDPSRKKWLQDQIGLGMPLTVEERTELRRITGDRMGDAYSDFLKALQANKDSIKAAVKSKALALSVFFDVFMGFAAPFLARGIKALAEKLPANASNASYRLALMALNEKDTERIFAQATKVGKELIKSYDQALFGETDVDVFLGTLAKSFRESIDSVNAKLSTLTDSDLGVVAAAYDPSVSDENYYKPIIKDLVSRFEKQVLPIGPPKHRRGQGRMADIDWTEQTDIVWAQVGSRKYLVKVFMMDVGFGSKISFSGFIDRDLKEAALARASMLTGGTATISSRDIAKFPVSIPEKATFE